MEALIVGVDLDTYTALHYGSVGCGCLVLLRSDWQRLAETGSDWKILIFYPSLFLTLGLLVAGVEFWAVMEYLTFFVYIIRIEIY